MKQKRFLLFLTIIMFGLYGIVHGQAAGDLVFTGGSSTDWNTAANWSISDGAGGYSGISSAVPSNSKNVWVPAGKTVNISNTAYALNATVSGTLTTASAAKRLVMGNNGTTSVFTNNGTITDGNLQLEIMRYASKLTITGTPLIATKFREVKPDDISSYTNGASQETVLDIDLTLSFTSLENYSATSAGTRIFTINAGKTLTLAASGFFGWWSTAANASYLPGNTANANDQEAWVYNINGTLDAATNSGMIILLTNLNASVTTNKITVNIGSAGTIKCGTYVCLREGNTSNTITVNNNGLISYKGTSYSTDRTNVGNTTFTQITNSLLATANKDVTFTSTTDVTLAHTASTGGDFNVGGNLNNGAKLILGAANLNVTGSGTIVGPSSTKYIVENSTGRLSIYCAANATVLFPIGSSTSIYAPATVTALSNSTIKAFASNSITYAPVDATKANATEWQFTSDINVNALLALTPISSTNNANPVIGIYTGGMWAEQSATYNSGTFTATAPVSIAASAILYTETGSSGAFTPLAVSSDATLSDLKINGVTIAGFSPTTLTYSYKITDRTSSVIPTVTYTTANINASAIQANATTIPGSTTITLTAQDGTTVKKYTINFDYVYGTNGTLSDLKVNGMTLSGFSPNKAVYKLWFPDGTTTVPTVTATAADPYAKSVLTKQASSIPDTATVTVTADDNTTVKVYKVIFKLIKVGPDVLAHPAIPFNIADLDRMKANINVEPWKSGYQVLISSSQASLSYVMQGPFDTVGRETNLNLTQYQNDGTAVLYQAIQYYMTGNANYAINAINILEAWTTTHTTWSGSTPFLAASDYGLSFIMGAEILRHTYPGWTLLNSAHCEDYFENVIWPQFTVPNPLRAANQGAAQLKGAVAVAVFCNDTAKFNQVINQFKNDACGGISNTLSNGENGDSGRDQPHSLGMIGNLATVAEVAWRQNIDLYSIFNNRILALLEYFSSYNLGNDVPWINFGTCYGYYTSIGSTGRGTTNWTVVNEMIYGHYVVRKGLTTSYVSTFRDQEPVSAETFMYRKDIDTSTAASTVAPVSDFITNVNVDTLTGVDIGTCSLPGSNTYNNGVWTVSGSGTDIKGNAASESFHYAYKQVSGDGSLVAKLTNIDNVYKWSKGGIMFRESLANTSNMLSVYLMPGAGEGSEATWRGATAAYGSYSQKDANVTSPMWLKITRRSNLFSGFISPDSVNWTPIANAIIPMANTFYMGLAIDSYTNDTLGKAVLSGVKTNYNSTILPIQLSSFEAKATGCNVLLNWNAAADDKSNYFNVERSVDGIKFEILQKVPVNRGAGGMVRYSFTDVNPAAGKNFYRISEIGYDGNKTYTGTRLINSNCVTAGISLFPNPASDNITITGMQNGTNLIRIISGLGQIIETEITNNGQKQLNIASLPPGVYQIQVLAGGAIIYTGKFIKLP